MEQTLEALAGILLKSIPTILLLLFLYFYLKAMLFSPLTKVLKQRDELTTGTRLAADRSLRDAEQRVQEYDAKLREARAELYREQEATRAQWLADQASQITGARQRTGTAVAEAKEQMAAEVVAARQSLIESSGTLADQIATAVLGGRAA